MHLQKGHVWLDEQEGTIMKEAKFKVLAKFLWDNAV